ncbi:uncharacterized protein LOC112144189 isoform X1 [Oryzias melastigma]|uniref:uncharacterized protein LOC112144189 isoform X1 n=1 Tax=Oryzias melastigma TaxID=30732 RepID=UPI000CF836FB|nr:uncharacterized protein LOC112144189 isoform X1 [Oryzias melastigma]
MEVSPFSFFPRRCWTEEKEKVLISFFSKHTCLWDHKSESYKNRELRQQTLEHLRILLSSHPPPVPFTVEEIKDKFKNLRTTFQRQYKLVQASRQCSVDEVFVPQWKHYHQLLFLQGCWDLDAAAVQPLQSPPAAQPEHSQPVLTSGLVASYLPSSSSVSSNITVKSFWTEERELTLILFYSEHSCLWNKKSENHNNRQLRQRLLESLREQLSDHSVSFSVEDIKCKFKNLLTVFNWEYKAVQASKASDKPYVSKWKHYQQLLFLCQSCEEDSSADDVQILMVQESKDVKPEKVKASPQAASPSRCPSDRVPCGNRSLLSAPANSRLSADPRCLWSEAKTQQLISFYSEHTCLWNHKSGNYKNRLLRQSLLETLSRLLSENEPVAFTGICHVEDIKTKFRNLRTVFQREHKVVSSNKTCGSEDFYLCKWKHYHELMFLCDSCDEKEPSEDLHVLEPQHLDSPPSPQYHPDNTADSSPNTTGLQAQPSSTLPDSQLSSSPSSSSSYTESRGPGRKRARQPEADCTGELFDMMRTVCQNQTASPHVGFLKYVEECLNEMPPAKVKKLKKKIIDLIHSVVEDG